MALKAPCVAQDILEQRFAAAAGLAVGTVVCTHHGFNTGFLDGCFKRGKVCLPQILLACVGVKFVALSLRTGVHGKMLGAGGCFEIFTVALQSLDEGDAETGGQIGVLAVRFVTAAPSRITEDIYVRRPESQTFVNVAIALGRLHIVLCAGFRGDHFRDSLEIFLIEHRSQADGLRKHGSGTGARHAMERLVPPVIGGNVQSRDSRGLKAKL